MIKNIQKVIDKLPQYSLKVKMAIYAIVFILSHFSTSIIYQLAMYRYSSEYNFPYIYTKQVPLEHIYPSMIYQHIPYLVINLVIYYVVVSLKMYNEKRIQTNGSSACRFDLYAMAFNHLDKKISKDNLLSYTLKTRDGVHFALMTLIVFILFLFFDNDTFLQQTGVLLLQFGIPIYFYYKIAHLKNYLTIFLTIIPILILLSSFGLLISSIFNNIMIENKIGGNINIEIFDKVNKYPMHAKLLFLSDSSIIVDYNQTTKILNKKDIKTISFPTK